MDSLIPAKTEKEKRAARIGCFLSFPVGSVPYLRDFGVSFDVDGASPASAQRAFALAVESAARYVPGVRATDGRIEAGLDGRVKISLKFEDVDQ